MPQQQKLARAIWLSAAMTAAAVLMLLAAVLSFIAHAPRVGEAFLAVLLLAAVIGPGSAFRAARRSRAFAQAGQEPQHAGPEGSFR